MRWLWETSIVDRPHENIKRFHEFLFSSFLFTRECKWYHLITTLLRCKMTHEHPVQLSLWMKMLTSYLLHTFYAQKNYSIIYKYLFCLWFTGICSFNSSCNDEWTKHRRGHNCYSEEIWWIKEWFARWRFFRCWGSQKFHFRKFHPLSTRIFSGKKIIFCVDFFPIHQLCMTWWVDLKWYPSNTNDFMIRKYFDENISVFYWYFSAFSNFSYEYYLYKMYHIPIW